jgi:hypothetical protein
MAGAEGLLMEDRHPMAGADRESLAPGFHGKGRILVVEEVILGQVAEGVRDFCSGEERAATDEGEWASLEGFRCENGFDAEVPAVD